MDSDNLVNRVLSSIKADALFSKKEPLVVGVSGGSDSIFLLHSLIELGFSEFLTVVYCDHHLRTRSEITYDQSCIRELISEASIPLLIKDVLVEDLMVSNRQSLEEAARYGRMEVFQSVCKEQCGSILVLGHHRDDVCETFFQQLLRGARTGLNGMKSKRLIDGCCVVRPLLNLKKNDILTYLNENHIAYSVDSTNSELDCMRNKYRHYLMPSLELLVPAYRDKLTDYMDYLAEWRDCEQELIQPVVSEFEYFEGGCRIKKEYIVSLPVFLQKRILYQLISMVSDHKCETMSAQINSIVGHLDAYTGFKLFSLPKGFQCRLDQTYVDCIDTSFQEGSFEHEVELPETTIHFPDNCTMSICLMDNVKMSSISFESPCNGYVDVERVDIQNLFVRFYKEGDRFWPYGMKKEIDLNDFFSAQKIPKTRRDSIPLVFSNTQLVWVAGVRVSETVKVTDGTRSVLSMLFKK